MAEFDSDSKPVDNGKEQEPEDKGPTFDWMPSGCSALADGEYDVIVMGTGLTECIVSGLLSTMKKRVLHLDRNPYYGAESASLALNNLFEKFLGPDGQEPPKEMGRVNDWAVDLIPKFIMADGELTKVLLYTKVTRYLDFKAIEGSFVYKGGKIEKVPTTPAEALASPLMGFFEKRKFRSFLIFIDKYNRDDPSTYMQGRPLDDYSARAMFEYYGLNAETQSFIGHAMALFTSDDYLDQSAATCAEAIKLYTNSMQRYEPYKSPYIYPVYGLGGLPEGFSRICAVNLGTYMLNTDVDEVIMKDGKAWGVKSKDQVAKAPIVIGDPSYFAKDKTKVVGKVVRSICILTNPVPNTNNCESAQIIIPGNQVGRTNDIFVCVVSSAHAVCKEGYYIAIVSTTVETDAPLTELEPGFNLLGPVYAKFNNVSDLYQPVNADSSDNCFISMSYDAASHFESTVKDVFRLYKQITGEELKLDIDLDNQDEDE